jgi:hypothetical protein
MEAEDGGHRGGLARTLCQPITQLYMKYLDKVESSREYPTTTTAELEQWEECKQQVS